MPDFQSSPDYKPQLPVHQDITVFIYGNLQPYVTSVLLNRYECPIILIPTNRWIPPKIKPVTLTRINHIKVKIKDDWKTVIIASLRCHFIWQLYKIWAFSGMQRSLLWSWAVLDRPKVTGRALRLQTASTCAHISVIGYFEGGWFCGDHHIVHPFP